MGGLLTHEAGRGRVGLDVLQSVALNHVPHAPHVAGVEDVEELARVRSAALGVLAEQVVVGAGVPLWGGGTAEERTVCKWKTKQSPFINICAFKKGQTGSIWGPPAAMF